MNSYLSKDFKIFFLKGFTTVSFLSKEKFSKIVEGKSFTFSKFSKLSVFRLNSSKISHILYLPSSNLNM